ncbi:MAG: hypothetical protein AAGF12_08740 [Myxococcota bacterium]
MGRSRWNQVPWGAVAMFATSGCSVIFPFDYEATVKDAGVEAGSDADVADASSDADAVVVSSCGECNGLCLEGRCRTITQLALGISHTCVLTSDGDVYCLGGADRLETGGPRRAQNRFVQISLLGPVDHLAAGDRHTCAVHGGAGPGLTCWGTNGEGPFGNGETALSAVPTTSNLPEADTPVRELALGANHTCVLFENGRVYCAGRGDEGQLGTGEETSSASFVPVFGLDASRTTTSIAAGGNTTCALQEGEVLCWGSNAQGQVGNGDSASKVLLPESTGLTDIRTLAVGTFHGCAIGNTGALSCWGFGSQGQLGDGAFDDARSPIEVDRFGTGPTPEDLAELALGARHSCVREETGEVWCWGSTLEGQDGLRVDSPTPQRPQRLDTTASLIASGAAHSCAIIKETGDLHCWGRDASGQAGGGDPLHRAEPFEVPMVLGAEVAGGAEFTCVLEISGGVSCFGANPSGQLGRGDFLRSSVPRPVVTDDGSPLSGVIKVATGSGHACAIAAGTVQCWGSNSFGQSGAAASSRAAPAVPEADRFVQLAAGSEHTCAVQSGGALYCWGLNVSRQVSAMEVDSLAPGQLSLPSVDEIALLSRATCARSETMVQCWGLRSQIGYDSATPGAPLPVPMIGNAIRLFGSWNGACALSDSLQCWGANVSRQLDSAGGALDIPRTVEWGFVPEDIAVGLNHVCATDGDGQVHCAGANEHGQLGQGDTDARPSGFVPVIGLDGVSALSAGTRHTCAVRGAQVWCWGRDIGGQLGTSRPLIVEAPTEVAQ